MNSPTLFNSCNCKPTERWRTTEQPVVGWSKNEGASPSQKSCKFLYGAFFPLHPAASFRSANGKQSCSLRFVFSLLEFLLFERLQELLNTDKNWIRSEMYETYYREKWTALFSENPQAVPTRPSSNGSRNQGWERCRKRSALISCWRNELNILLEFWILVFLIGGGGDVMIKSWRMGGLLFSGFVSLNFRSLVLQACGSTWNLIVAQHLQDLEKLLKTLIDGTVQVTGLHDVYRLPSSKHAFKHATKSSSLTCAVSLFFKTLDVSDIGFHVCVLEWATNDSIVTC